jgi:arylsulfatase A-like enzyme
MFSVLLFSAALPAPASQNILLIIADDYGADSSALSQQDINANPRPYFEAMIEAMDTEMGRLLANVDRANTHIK